MKKLPLRTPTPPVSVASAPGPLWAGGEVGIPVTDVGSGLSGKVKIRAKLRGPVAVHEDLNSGRKDRWQVTARATGMVACRNLASEAEALRVGAVLAGQGALGLKSKAAVLNALAPWVGQWCLACTEAGKYLDPAPYRRGDGR